MTMEPRVGGKPFGWMKKGGGVGSAAADMAIHECDASSGAQERAGLNHKQGYSPQKTSVRFAAVWAPQVGL